MVDTESINPGMHKYLEKIESRLNRKGRLAHEIGAGAACLKCGDKCPGFELHYWRKVCLNCRCSKDDHNIQDDDYDIGYIIIGKLFDRPDPFDRHPETTSGPLPATTGYNNNSSSNNNNKEGICVTLALQTNPQSAPEPHQFDWVPPNVEPDLAARYMTALPEDKRPIAGTQAARDRRQQLGAQLPLYDLDETQQCEALAPRDLQNFQQHMEHVRTHVVGQGTVAEVQRAPRLMVGVATATKAVGDDEGIQTVNSGAEVQNPHAWASPKKSVPHFHVRDNSKFGAAADNNNIEKNQWPADPPPINELTHPLRGNCTAPDQMLQEQMQGLSLQGRQVGSNRAAVDLPHPYTASSSTDLDQARSLIGQTSTNNNNNTAEHLESVQLVPPYKGYTGASLPPGGVLLSSPRRDESVQHQTHSEPYRERLTGTQMLSSSDDVSVLLAAESSALGRRQPPVGGASGPLVAAGHIYQQVASEHSCQHCELPLMAGAVAVICERAGPEKFWHPGCFVCSECGELLADMIYFWHQQRVYCGRHYHQAASVARCHACDELIFSDSWTRAEGRNWHLAHFTCFLCDKQLAGESYVPGDNCHPYCLPCHMQANAKMCETCEQKITPGAGACSYRDYHYHATSACFSCHGCRAPLLGGKFKMVKNWLFCSQTCVDSSQQEIEANPNTKFRQGDLQ